MFKSPSYSPFSPAICDNIDTKPGALTSSKAPLLTPRQERGLRNLFREGCWHDESVFSPGQIPNWLNSHSEVISPVAKKNLKNNRVAEKVSKKLNFEGSFSEFFISKLAEFFSEKSNTNKIILVHELIIKTLDLAKKRGLNVRAPQAVENLNKHLNNKKIIYFGKIYADLYFLLHSLVFCSRSITATEEDRVAINLSCKEAADTLRKISVLIKDPNGIFEELRAKHIKMLKDKVISNYSLIQMLVYKNEIGVSGQLSSQKSLPYFWEIYYKNKNERSDKIIEARRSYEALAIYVLQDILLKEELLTIEEQWLILFSVRDYYRQEKGSPFKNAIILLSMIGPEDLANRNSLMNQEEALCNRLINRLIPSLGRDFSNLSRQDQVLEKNIENFLKKKNSQYLDFSRDSSSMNSSVMSGVTSRTNARFSIQERSILREGVNNFIEDVQYKYWEFLRESFNNEDSRKLIGFVRIQYILKNFDSTIDKNSENNRESRQFIENTFERLQLLLANFEFKKKSIGFLGSKSDPAAEKFSILMQDIIPIDNNVCPPYAFAIFCAFNSSSQRKKYETDFIKRNNDILNDYSSENLLLDGSDLSSIIKSASNKWF